MTLTSVEIQGFRSIRRIRLPLRRLTVLLGANGVGKTNLYRSLELLHSARPLVDIHQMECVGVLRSQALLPVCLVQFGGCVAVTGALRDDVAKNLNGWLPALRIEVAKCLGPALGQARVGLCIRRHGLFGYK